MASCKLCDRVLDGNLLRENDLCAAVLDAFPLNPGHTLVVPRRHIGRYFDLNREEKVALWDLVTEVEEWVTREFTPDGYNVGINDGVAAGQTIAHVHVHVIPRHEGDVQSPRGGIRWVIPGRAAYWNA